MKYELKYEDFSKDPVSAVPGDILVLVYEDGSKRIFRTCVAQGPNTCSGCRISGRSEHFCGVSCTHWNFSCPHDRHIIYTSIDTLLEDL